MEHLTQLWALGVTMDWVGGRKKMKLLQYWSYEPGEKNGEVYKAKYWFAKKNFEKSQTVRLGGGGVRCHSTICKIAGFSHGFCPFSIVSPYEYFSHRFKWKRTSFRSFCDMIWNCTLRTKICPALRLFVQNADKNAQCHFSWAGINGTGWNFGILGYTTSALCWAHDEPCLQARAWFTKYAHHIILCLSNTLFQCGVGSRIQNSLLEMYILDVSRRAWFTKDALHMPKTYKCLVYSLHLPTTY